MFIYSYKNNATKYGNIIKQKLNRKCIYKLINPYAHLNCELLNLFNW